jgi:hypothetical protein|tara:strand:- start:8953 stop:9216 length:264 start_codon:yes stop_codon:yes gene_type:complete
MNLIDKLIVVTGAASGIGAESGYYFDDTKRYDECKRDAPVAQCSGSPRIYVGRSLTSYFYSLSCSFAGLCRKFDSIVRDLCFRKFEQ